jgi:hypothetical protein
VSTSLIDQVRNLSDPQKQLINSCWLCDSDRSAQPVVFHHISTLNSIPTYYGFGCPIRHSSNCFHCPRRHSLWQAVVYMLIKLIFINTPGFSLLMFGGTIWALVFGRTRTEMNKPMLLVALLLLVLSTTVSVSNTLNCQAVGLTTFIVAYHYRHH